jgi:hypothetical protein
MRHPEPDVPVAAGMTGAVAERVVQDDLIVPHVDEHRRQTREIAVQRRGTRVARIVTRKIALS